MFSKPENGKSRIEISGEVVGYVYEDDKWFPARLLWTAIKSGAGKSWPGCLVIQDENTRLLFVIEKDCFYIIKIGLIENGVRIIQREGLELFKEWAEDIRKNIKDWEQWVGNDKRSVKELRCFSQEILNW